MGQDGTAADFKEMSEIIAFEKRADWEYYVGKNNRYQK